MNEEPRAITQYEARKEFLEELKQVMDYWSGDKVSEGIKSRIEGAIFSILVLMDGGREFPGLNLILSPHPKDKEYFIEEGSNYYEDGMCINEDIELHEAWCNFLNKSGI